MDGTMTARETEVTRELNQLEKSLNKTGERINSLREKLNPILSVKLSPTGESEKETKVCSLAQRIRDFRRQSDNLCGQVVSILEEIEL